MKKDKEGELRRRAEATFGASNVAATDAKRLVHELEVYQVELNLQNEELRGSRVEAEAALERYTELFDFAPIGYAVLSDDGTIRELNLCGAQLLGNDRAALVGRRLETFVAAGARPQLRLLLADVLLDDAPSSCDLELATAGFVHCTATVVHRAQSKVLLAFADITAQREHDQRLAAADQALRDGEKRKDEFLSALSHELRNPLGPIRNSLFIMTHAEPGSAQASGALSIIDRQVSHLSRLVDDLLDVTRIARGKMQIHRERTDLADLVRRSVDDHRSSFEASGVALETQVEPSIFAIADGARLMQVMSNLLGNAEKFTPHGGRVTVSLRRIGTTCELRVRDNGAGIEPSILPHVFEPFAQAPQTVDRSRGGLGLGLATVKGLVELHDGSVAIVSAGTGRGTEAIVRLPIEGGGASTTPLTQLPETAPHRILLIDDNVDAARSLQEALVMLGHDVRIAFTGTDGLAVARQFNPEVVICDIGLPDIDGYEVATQFRGDPVLERCFLVALSGYARPSDVERARHAGFDRHLAKPTSVHKLAEVVAEARSVQAH